jgi:hypothetical protein
MWVTGSRKNIATCKTRTQVTIRWGYGGADEGVDVLDEVSFIVSGVVAGVGMMRRVVLHDEDAGWEDEDKQR